MEPNNSKRGITPDLVRDYTPLTATKRLITYFRPYMGMTVIALLLGILSSALLVLRPYLIKVVIDNHITTGKLEGLGKFMFILVILYLLRLLAGYWLGLITGMLGQKVMHDLRMDIFGHILSMDMNFFDHNQVGRLMTRTTDDVNALNELYTSGAVRILNNSTILIGIVAVMFMLDWKLAVVTLTVLPLLYLTAHTFASRIRTVYSNIRKGTARLNASLQESIQGMKIIQIMQRTNWSYRKFEKYSEDLMDSKVRNVFYYGLFFPAMEFLASIALALILISSGWLITHEALQIGVIIAFIRLVDMFFWPIRELAENFNVMLSALAASERIFTLLDTKSMVVDQSEFVEISEETGIVFENVWFAYEGDEWVLRDVSFAAAPGERVALVGPSGAGKTSIASLLLRFYDVRKGRILLNGTDIREIPIAQLRKRISFVGQDPFLFNRSVAENISLGDPEIDDERIRTVLSRMEALDFFDGLEEGIQTKVRERGSRLSQGQRQLISFARALAADRQLLVLDEATSNIDTFTETLIQKAVPILMENRTSIVIAHRLSTVRNVDRIHVIARGKIRETGNHDDLMRLDGIYAKLSRMYIEGQGQA